MAFRVGPNQVCYHWAANEGWCKKGFGCRFAHPDIALLAPELLIEAAHRRCRTPGLIKIRTRARDTANYKKKPCHEWTLSNNTACPRGLRCTYQHT